ncbi:MAG: glucose-1-phosphate cytidylyltransferase, partial [Thermoplasmata archaeon]|nr:glucose-1-phosphate cytidylyltransferase [Thermoplasmata archaeon]
EPWKVTLVDTGENTGTGGRLKRIRNYLEDDIFCFTYGDGLCDVNIRNLINFHKTQKTLATVTAVQPPGRFGSLNIEGEKVGNFVEKPLCDGGWINGGYFVLSPKVVDYIDGDITGWEGDPIQRLSMEGELSAFKHDGFWKPMDTLRDKNVLEDLWNRDEAPWKIW